MRDAPGDDYCFDIGPMGAIGEQGSLMLRINRHCPWNRCLFCSAYKGVKFEYRTEKEIKRDIDAIERLSHMLSSAKPGQPGEVVREVLSKHPEVYDDGSVGEQALDVRYASLTHVARWLVSGARTVFLQDADALIMRTPELLEVLTYLRAAFPSIERITSYARSRTLTHKPVQELRALREAGLSRVLVGVESGCDAVLEFMQKGVTAEEHIRAGRKVVEAKIRLVAFVMPGLGGKGFRDQHMVETAVVLNQMRPDLIRLRSLAIQRSSPLYKRYEDGAFGCPSDDDMVDEIELLVRSLDFPCEIETGQLTNMLFEIAGKLPEDREDILKTIGRYKAMSHEERLRFRFQRYSKYYLPYVIDRGRSDFELEEQFEEAYDRLQRGAADAERKIEQAIFEMKSRCIP
ncbi:MAG: radical SAM protein [Chloroflexi bacterium]|nr:radical SAM protein [Chloroflexota bacterium]